MEHKAYFKNKAGSNAFTTHSDKKRDIPKRLFHHYSFALQSFY